MASKLGPAASYAECFCGLRKPLQANSTAMSSEYEYSFPILSNSSYLSTLHKIRYDMNMCSKKRDQPDHIGDACALRPVPELWVGPAGSLTHGVVRGRLWLSALRGSVHFPEAPSHYIFRSSEAKWLSKVTFDNLSNLPHGFLSPVNDHHHSVTFSRSKLQITVNTFKKFSICLTENTLCFHNKDQFVNDIYGNNWFLFRESHETHSYTRRKERSFEF
jgi:hypothetical protein